MIFIGGVNNKSVELAPLKSIMCKHCRENHEMKFYKSFFFFHFFFIPLWKWKVTYYVICEDCQSTMKIPLEKGKELEHHNNLELTLWDMEIINEGEEPQNVCHHCHEKVAKSYHFCPYCGEKV